MAILPLQAEVALGGLDGLARRDDEAVEGGLGVGADDFKADPLPLLGILGR